MSEIIKIVVAFVTALLIEGAFLWVLRRAMKSEDFGMVKITTVKRIESLSDGQGGENERI
jgi:flagellar biogenesis protein FliO